MTALSLTLDEARAYIATALVRCKTSAENAAIVADALVRAEADGLKTHGLQRVPTYGAQAKVGKVDGVAVPRVEHVTPAVIHVDAAHGFAYPAIRQAVAALAEATPMIGLAAAAIRRSHHCGVAGHHVEALAEKGLVALMFANTPSAIAPWGGRKGVFGTNPIAFACPLPGREPIVVDLALSKIARGNIMVAKQRGEAIPEGWALDPDGNPTTDPDLAIKGTMVPLGDAKGTALALMVELLAAGLTQATFAADASGFLDDRGPPPATGQLIVAFDPTLFGGEGTLSHFARLAAQIEDQPGARLPGGRRLALREKADREGIAVDETLQKQIAALSA